MKNQNKSHSSKHMLMMVIGCILPLILLYAASEYFGFSANYMLWGVIILCVGMHIQMMKKHKGGHNHG